MANLIVKSIFFRSISVQYRKIKHELIIFRSIPVHIKSMSAYFRSIPVHRFVISFYFCTVKHKISAKMAGTIKSMNLIKQVLQLKKLGESNRGVAKKLPIDKETVNGYMRTIKDNNWQIPELIKIDDPELERMFHAGNPAYTDNRMEEFLSLLPYFREQLSNPKLHVSRFLLFEEYRKGHPNGYGKSQFFFHLKQNLVAQKDIVTVMANTYKPGEKLMVDYAGDKLSYIDLDTGEIIKVEVFVACMPYSDYPYVICVPSQKTEDFLYAIRMCLEYLGGVPPIITPDNLKAAVIKADRHEPEINTALRDMGNHYHFVVLPCDPVSPTQKSLVEDEVKITYNRIYARLRNKKFYSLLELNKAVWELVNQHNQTRMQKRPYSREERFHSMEKHLLQPLPDVIYEMRYYADLKVQLNGHIELRHNKITHYYSVPFYHVGKKAKVVFTRSWVKIYIEGKLVATHMRSYEFGYTYVREHLASNSAAIVERSASHYVVRAAHNSDDCKAYITEIFNPQRTNQPEEIYYRLCDAVLSSYRRYEKDVVDKTCSLCIEYKVFSYKRFEAILKNYESTKASDESACTAPIPKNHENMRGNNYFQ